MLCAPRPLFLILVSLALCALTACSDSEKSAESWLDKDFSAYAQAAEGREVRWAMFGGWNHVNTWVDSYVSEQLQERYGIDLVRVPMDASVFVNKLLNEKAAGKETGTIDLLWINGENFKKCREAEVLFGPFAAKLPNYQHNVDAASVAQDFGYAHQGYEAPWGRAQFVFEYDTRKTPSPPETFAQLTTWIKKHPGRFTYPQPPDFTGSAFVRQAFTALTGGYKQYMHGFDQKLYSRQAPKLWAWLNEIEPHLWQSGQTYPKDSAALDTLFARGEVLMSMSYHPPHAQNKILEGTYPQSVRTFILDSGSLYNTHYTAIPWNAPNKPGAMLTANFLLSVQAQVSKLKPANWGDFPVLDMKALRPEQRERFQSVDLGPATLSPAFLAQRAVPEIPIAYLERLEEDWSTHVLHDH